MGRANVRVVLKEQNFEAKELQGVGKHFRKKKIGNKAREKPTV